MKKVLLIGSSYSSAPILNVLRRKGFHISVCGAAESDPCHLYADQSFFLDYSKADELVALIRKEGFDFIVPSCNDFAYLSGVVAAAEFGFPGFDAPAIAEVIHTKRAFRQFTLREQVPAPRWVSADEMDLAGALRLPLLVKPDDAFSGRGVTKLQDLAGLPDAVEKAKGSSRSGSVVIEEFVEGALHSHSAFVRAGEIVQDFFVDEFCTVYPYQVDSSNHPSFLTLAMQDGVRDVMAQLVRTLGLCDGLLHTQFISAGDRFWIIESMRRAPGDLYPNLISYSAGVDYFQMYTQPFIGETITFEPLGDVRFVGRHTISVDQSRSLFSFSHAIPSEKVEIVPLKLSGSMCKEAPYDKAAILFAEFDALDRLRTVVPDLKHYIKIRTIEGNSFDWQ